MEIKSAVIFEAKKNDKLYQFIAPIGSPLGECYDAVYEILGEVLEQAKKATEAAKKDVASVDEPTKVETSLVDAEVV